MLSKLSTMTMESPFDVDLGKFQKPPNRMSKNEGMSEHKRRKMIDEP